MLSVVDQIAITLTPHNSNTLTLIINYIRVKTGDRITGTRGSSTSVGIKGQPVWIDPITQLAEKTVRSKKTPGHDTAGGSVHLAGL